MTQYGTYRRVFTDLAPLRLWIAISNPRQTSGRFYDCFHKDRAFWHTKTIDSRTVEGIDGAVYQRIADKYGEDHDVTRVEVKGEFPKSRGGHRDQPWTGRSSRGS